MAVFAEGNLAPTIKDLRLAESKQSLPQTPVSLVYAGPKSSDTSGADEWDLDTQTSTGVAPRASRLYIYVATSLSDSDLSKAINKWVTQDVARSASASLGECDVLPYLDGSMKVDDTDRSSRRRRRARRSSPRPATRAAAARSRAPTASRSAARPTPSTRPRRRTRWQSAARRSTPTTATTTRPRSPGTPVAAASRPSRPRRRGRAAPCRRRPRALRGVPDIALDADPNTGAQIYVSGVETQIGGTSLSSPMALGFWTRLQASHGNKLGFAAPRLYKLYAGPDRHDTRLPRRPARRERHLRSPRRAGTTRPAWAAST